MNERIVDLIDKTDFENLTWNNWKKAAPNQPGEIISRSGNYCASFSLSDILNTTLTKSWALKPDTYYMLSLSLQTPNENNRYSIKWNDRHLEEQTLIPAGGSWKTVSVTFRTSPVGFPPEDTIELTIERGMADNLVLLDDLALYDLD